MATSKMAPPKGGTPNTGGTSISVGDPNIGGTSISVDGSTGGSASVSSGTGPDSGATAFIAPIQNAPTRGIDDTVGQLTSDVAQLKAQVRALLARQ
jgi:hypothetical protein